MGRRLAYLGRFREAIESFTEGIKKFPLDARFYRHRGHRYITLRRFDLAIDDLTKATKLIKDKPDEVEPDGLPNARKIPTSTLQSNIWYHLGLAQYLTGNYNEALRSYRRCLDVSENPDGLVAATHWIYMTLRRMNKERDAQEELEPISEGMDIIENTGYYPSSTHVQGPDFSRENASRIKETAGFFRDLHHALRDRQLVSLQWTPPRGPRDISRNRCWGSVDEFWIYRSRGRSEEAVDPELRFTIWIRI